MKKLLFSLAFFLSVLTVMSQSARQFVLSEDFTSTKCTYCPGAAMGMDDLLSNGKMVAVVASHSNGMGTEPFTNTYSAARNTMYNVSAFPSVAFDGIKGYVGGNHSTTMYGTYLPLYNQCIALTSPVTMSMVVTNAGLNFTAVVTLTKTDVISSASNILYFFVTQSNIAYNWEGQSELNHVNRLMVPNENGTPVDFSGGDVQSVTLNFAMDAAWPLADCEFIAALQDKDAGQGTIPGTAPYALKEWKVYQCVKRGAIDLTPGFTASATSVPKNSTVTFTNTTYGGYIGVPETYHWIFPGAAPDTSNVKNPSVVYTDCGPHDVTLIVNRGGQIETLVKSLYIMVGPVINIVASPNDSACYYLPITLDATTPNATAYLWTPGGATTPTITLDAATIGLGLHTYSCEVTADQCTNTQDQTIFFDACTGIANNTTNINASIYPNPNTGTFILELNTGKTEVVDLKIMNSLGSTIYTESNVVVATSLVKTISLKNVPAGMYYMTIRNGQKNIVQKFCVQ